MHRERDTKTLQDLWQLRDMPERVGDITNFLNVPKVAGDAVTKHKIADKRFAADKEFIGQHIPWSNSQTTFMDKLLKSLAFLGTELKIILQHNGLSVEVEVSIGDRKSTRLNSS